MNVYEAATKRRSIRRFQNRPVPYEALERCVEAARLAPAGRNSQICEYLVVDSTEGLAAVFDNIGGSVKLPPEKGGPRPDQKAKAYILVLINKALEGDSGRRRITQIDIGLAAENIMLTALEQGIGTCAVTTFDEPNLKQAFAIPAEYDIGLVILMGYPDEQPVTEAASTSLTIYVDERGVRHVPKRKLEDIIHRNKVG
jgi:nitroreductase